MGFVKDGNGYRHPGIRLALLKRKLRIEATQFQSIPNTAPGTPQTEVEFANGRVHFTYHEWLLSPNSDLADDDAKVEAYFWFYP